MFCSEESTIIITMITIILGLSLSSNLLARFSRGTTTFDDNDYNLSIAVLVFWILSLFVTIQYGDRVSSTYVILTGFNVVTACMIIARHEEDNFEIDNSLNIVAGITVAFNVLALFITLYDMYQSKHFKGARVEFARGNITKGMTMFIKDFIGPILK
jgi:hypothetical protein